MLIILTMYFGYGAMNTSLVISQLSMVLLSEGTFTWTAFVLAVSICITWPITYGPYVSDHSRFMHAKHSSTQRVVAF